jgi:hypothetical protein
MESQFLDIEAARKFIEQSVKHYEKTAPAWFVQWLDDFYIRLGESPRTIVLDELITVSRLYKEDAWMAETLAVNMAYKLYDRLGRDTTGIIGY